MPSGYGRCLMLDLSLLNALEASRNLFWPGSDTLFIFPAAASHSALVFWWSTLERIILVGPLVLSGGLLAKFKWQQATVFSGGSPLQYIYSLECIYISCGLTNLLEAKPRWPPLPFPCHRSQPWVLAYWLLQVGASLWFTLCAQLQQSHIIFAD